VSRVARDDLEEATPLGGVYLRRLRRAQLGLSLLALAAFAGLVGALPLVLELVPALRRIQVLGVPVALALLLAPPFVAFVALAWLYERRADGLDDAFRDLVERP
jgi:uncharacterized membrane protein